MPDQHPLPPFTPNPSSATLNMSSYEKRRRIAKHGQGEVWEVPHRDGTEVFAQKFLQEGMAESDVKRFHREVRTQSSLDHPGIMPIHAVDFNANPPWFIMPLAQGTLEDYIEKHSVLTEVETAEIAIQICEALNYAHGQGVIHRDVKPQNILLLEGRWVLSDFGLCRDYTAESTTVTKTGIGLGTLPYMAPEQWTDPHNVKAEADIYALGKILYQCSTGAPPWPSIDIDAVPDQLTYVVSKCLNDNPDKRYHSPKLSSKI